MSLVLRSDLPPLPEPPTICCPLERYQKLEKLGPDNHGSHYKSLDLVTGEIVVLKRVRLEFCEDGVPSTALREVSLLRELSHPCVIQLKDVIYDDGRLYLVFEHLSGDLASRINPRGKKLKPLLIKSYMYQLLQGITYIHRKTVLHRDLKPQNLLVHEGALKIANFGLARNAGVSTQPLTHEVVTLWYRAPEILLGAELYGPPIDIWSIGCIFAEMVMRAPLFPGDSEIDQLFRIFRALGTPTEEVWPGLSNMKDFTSTFPKWAPRSIAEMIPDMDPEGLDLLTRMLVYDPSKRISSVAAMQHVYFDELKNWKFKLSSQPRREKMDFYV